MGYYRKRAFDVEAWQWDENAVLARSDLPTWVLGSLENQRIVKFETRPGVFEWRAVTPYGVRSIAADDWVVRYPGGGVYIVARDAFATAYEAVKHEP